MCVGVACADASVRDVSRVPWREAGAPRPAVAVSSTTREGEAGAPAETAACAWGLSLRSGRLWSSPSALAWGARGPKLYPGLSAKLFGAVIGARITLIVDTDARTLAFRINEMPVVEAGITLPESVRPWALLGWKGDLVKLVAYSCDADGGAEEAV